MDHLDQLIKIGKTQNERIMSQTIIRTFKKPNGEGDEGSKHSEKWWRRPNGDSFDY